MTLKRLSYGLALAALLFFLPLSLIAEEEYWKDFFYLIDGKNYDKAPLFYHPLTEREAESMGDYTVVYLDELGILKEALTFQSRQPLYYYYYLYGKVDEERQRPMARISYYFKDKNQAVKSNLVYYYYCTGRLCATSYFEYSLLMPGQKMRSFTKLYEEGQEPRTITEFELLSMPPMLEIMNDSEAIIDKAMADFRGGELFLNELSGR